MRSEREQPGDHSTLQALPRSAAWRHVAARDGVEVVFLSGGSSGTRLEGHVAAVEDGETWAVRYEIVVDERWVTRSARVQRWTESGECVSLLESDGSGSWAVDGQSVPRLDGCLDIDLEASACTNTLPVHRLGLDLGEGSDASAVYVRVHDIEVERLEQHYAHVADDATSIGYDYRAPAFDFQCRLTLDRAGLVVAYPGIASRLL